MAPHSRRFVLLTILLVGLVLVVVFSAPWWLPAAAEALIEDRPPTPADAIIVLAGDYHGKRILKGCDLAREGFAPVVLVSGPMPLYGINEADLAIGFAVRNGCNPAWLRPVYTHAMSTEEEARQMDRLLAGQPGIRSALLVTSSFHTARALRIFQRQMGRRIALTPVAAPATNFRPDSWWQNREGRKTMFMETTKTVANWLGF